MIHELDERGALAIWLACGNDTCLLHLAFSDCEVSMESSSPAAQFDAEPQAAKRRAKDEDEDEEEEEDEFDDPDEDEDEEDDDYDDDDEDFDEEE